MPPAQEKLKDFPQLDYFDSVISPTSLMSKESLQNEHESVTLKMMKEAVELSEKGMSVEKISAQLSKSVGWVKGSLLIIKKLPDSVHKAIQENKLSRISAIQLLLCPTDKLEEVINGCIKLSEMNGNKL